MLTPRERWLTANGLKHHVLEWGAPSEAPSVVLCHGFLDCAFSFCELAERLVAAGHHVLSFDWRGHGETDWIGEGGYYHFADYVLDLHLLLPQLTARPCHLVGHSMGGSACTLFAASHPDALESLSLLEGMGPPAPPPAPFHQRLSTWLSAVDRERQKTAKPMASLADVLARVRRRTPDLPEALGLLLAEKNTKPAPDGAGRLWRWDPMHRTPGPYGFDAARMRECLGQITAPTLCVAGSRGMRTGDDEARYAALPDRRRVEIPDCGHMMHWTHPDALAEALVKFFSGAR